MDFTFEWLPEPKLQFGQYFEHEDNKTGLAEFGPFGLNVPGLHCSEIKVGFVGTRETIAGAKEWIQECKQGIESHNVKRTGKSAPHGPDLFGAEPEPDDEAVRLAKILDRDFIGFNRHSRFQCEFAVNDRWDRPIEPREIERRLKIDDKQRRILELVDLFEAEIRSLAEISPRPNIIVVALTPEIEDQAHAVRVSGSFHLNFRRALKARSMRWGIPLQLIQRSTVLGKPKRGKALQEKATRAWNFCTAQYYKAEGVPWRLADGDPDVCFVGVSFYVARDLNERLAMRASVAQAFDFLGQGFVLRGEPFEWDEDKLGKFPHLTRSDARALVTRTLQEYVRIRHQPPRRVVIHKSSGFWGPEHADRNEMDGFQEGIADVFSGCESDLVVVRQAGLRLFREGNYPPLRGTYFTLDGSDHFIYTQGFTPYLETYPNAYVPEPWYLAEHHGGGAPKDLLRDVLRLTKMNVNNCAFADGTPITLSFSRMIGEIMQHIPEDGIVHPEYRFYM
jgi:hypothetical protein